MTASEAELRAALGRLCAGKPLMRIPVDERDDDRILDAAITELVALLAEVNRLRLENHDLRAEGVDLRATVRGLVEQLGQWQPAGARSHRPASSAAAKEKTAEGPVPEEGPPVAGKDSTGRATGCASAVSSPNKGA